MYCSHDLLISKRNIFKTVRIYLLPKLTSSFHISKYENQYEVFHLIILQCEVFMRPSFRLTTVHYECSKNKIVIPCFLFKG